MVHHPPTPPHTPTPHHVTPHTSHITLCIPTLHSTPPYITPTPHTTSPHITPTPTPTHQHTSPPAPTTLHRTPHHIPHTLSPLTPHPHTSPNVTSSPLPYLSWECDQQVTVSLPRRASLPGTIRWQRSSQLKKALQHALGS